MHGNIIDYNNIKHIYFVGIGGIGMSAIAKIMMEKGYKIYGSDQNPGELTKMLKKQGATIYDSHRSENINENIDLLIYSSAISENNPERQEALRKKIPQIKRAEILSTLMESAYSIAVAGTHGKTTTSSMISYLAIKSKLDPTIAIGGVLNNLKTNARLGKSNYFITEADEYDRSFLKLNPDLAVITNIETDHLDCYGNFDNIKNAFKEFINHIKQDGTLVCNIDSSTIKEILPEITKNIITYGINCNADYRAKQIHFSKNQSTFSVYHKNELTGNITLNIPGRHNISNALATIALGIKLGIPFKEIKDIIPGYTGVERRFEVKGIINDIMIIDDYAHHPTEIDATIRSVRDGWKNRLIIIFQPHLYSRTGDFYKEFANALIQADIIIITEIYAARENPVNHISGEMIADYANELAQRKIYYIKNMTSIPEFISPLLQPQDIVITMGAGDIWKVGEELIKRLTSTRKGKYTNIS